MSEPENKTGILMVGSKLAAIASTELNDTDIIVEYLDEVSTPTPFQGDVIIDNLSAMAELYDPRRYLMDIETPIGKSVFIIDEFHDISDEVLITMGKRSGKFKPKRQ